MKSHGRGFSTEMVTSYDGVDVSCVQWHDNKIVLLLSSLTGEIPFQVQTFVQSKKKKIDIKCQNIVSRYNKLI